jgi:branched-chain amino acid transport system permease protein
MVLALLVALAGQGWNILGGYGGQFSFGHAAFFGTGAYGTAILQQRFGVNAYVAFAAAAGAGAAVGAIIGFLSFRSGLRGSYFALVTLAFAEVFRILANASRSPAARPARC